MWADGRRIEAMRTRVLLKLAWVLFCVLLGQLLGAMTAWMLPGAALASAKEVILWICIGGSLLMAASALALWLMALGGWYKPPEDSFRIRWDIMGSWGFLFVVANTVSYVAAL
jgi:hypothetical protein